MQMTTSPNANQLVTPKHMVKFYGVAPSTLWRWIKEGHVPEPIRIGRRTYWEWGVIEQHLKRLRQQAN